MANIRKSFNLRNGVQVDDDNFIVNANGLVGIGTSSPSEILDVYGNVKLSETLISKQVNSQNLNVSGITTLSRLISQNFINIGITSITSGIIQANTGVVTYYGDGGRLLNLPTSQWLDVDAGLGFTSIYAQGNVGVGTTDPRFVFQIGGNNNVANFQRGVGINTLGDIYATGIITSSNFTGIGSLITSINAANVTLGTLNNSRLPSNLNISGIVTAGNYFSGTLIGVAATANDVTGTSTINIAGATIGVTTVTNILHAENRIGIGTNVTNADLHVRKSGISSIRLTSNGSFPSRIIFGRNATLNDGNAELRFGNTDGLYTYSTEDSLDIINYDNGNFNYYNNVSGGSGNYYWFQGAGTNLMTLTSDGKLGINLDSPQNNLHVVGTSTVTSNSFVGGNFSVAGNVTINGSFNTASILVPGSATFNSTVGILTASPSSTYGLQVGANPLNAGGGVGITSTGNIVARQDISSRNISASGIATFPTLIATSNIQLNSAGILTATRFSGDGSTLTSLNATNISSGTLDNSRLPSTIILSGNLTAANVTANTNLSGNGSNITALNASNISSGTLNNLRLPTAISITGNIASSAGNLSGVNGTFTGTVSATGNVSGANGTFTGDVSGNDGTFTGDVTGASLSTGNGKIEIIIAGNQLTFVDVATGNSATLTLS
jgi:hypothetical protein